MKWTRTLFNHRQVADVQLGEVCSVYIRGVQKADVAQGSIMRQDAPGPMPAPRKPGDDRRQEA